MAHIVGIILVASPHRYDRLSHAHSPADARHNRGDLGEGGVRNNKGVVPGPCNDHSPPILSEEYVLLRMREVRFSRSTRRAVIRRAVPQHQRRIVAEFSGY